MIQNCWQFKECGYNAGGDNVGEDGPCPAYRETRLHGANRGHNGGRACWVVDGTYCDGTRQGTFVQKLSICRGCDFHSLVRREEGDEYMSSSELLSWLKG